MSGDCAAAESIVPIVPVAIVGKVLMLNGFLHEHLQERYVVACKQHSGEGGLRLT